MQAAKRFRFQLWDEISDESRKSHTYNNLKIGTLFLVGQLADEYCVSIFTRQHVKMFKNGKVIIKGRRNPSSGLYNIPLTTTADMLIPLSIQKQSLRVIQDSREKGTCWLLSCVRVHNQTSIIPNKRQERPLQMLACTHSHSHLQTSRKIHCHKYGPH